MNKEQEYVNELLATRLAEIASWLKGIFWVLAAQYVFLIGAYLVRM